MTWYDEYFNLEEKIELMQEDNEKMKREIQRRTERYVNNEVEYRKEIGELERELRLKKRFEEWPQSWKNNAELEQKHMANVNEIDAAINANIDHYEEQLKSLEDE